MVTVTVKGTYIQRVIVHCHRDLHAYDRVLWCCCLIAVKGESAPPTPCTTVLLQRWNDSYGCPEALLYHVLSLKMA